MRFGFSADFDCCCDVFVNNIMGIMEQADKRTDINNFCPICRGIHLAIIIRGVMMERLRHTIFVHVAVWNGVMRIILPSPGQNTAMHGWQSELNGLSLRKSRRIGILRSN